MNVVLSDLLASNRVVTPAGETLKLHSQIPQMECEIIQAWIREFSPKRVLEIGLAYGISSLFICDALREHEYIEHHIVDPNQSTDWQSAGLSHLRQAGYADRINFHEEPSELCLPRLLAEGYEFDFALIDGFHTFDHVMLDFFYVNRLLTCGGIVVLDDIQYPSIERVVSFIDTLPAYRRLPVPEDFARDRRFRVRKMLGVPGSRIIGFQKITVDDRPHDWHQEF